MWLAVARRGEGIIICGRRCPIVPAVGLNYGEYKLFAEHLRFLGFALLAFVEDAQEENPGEFGDVLHCAVAVGAAHDVADAFDRLINGLLRREVFFRSILLFNS